MSRLFDLPIAIKAIGAILRSKGSLIPNAQFGGSWRIQARFASTPAKANSNVASREGVRDDEVWRCTAVAIVEGKVQADACNELERNLAERFGRPIVWERIECVIYG